LEPAAELYPEGSGRVSSAIFQTIRVTPAMLPGLADMVKEIEELLAMLR